MKTKWEMNRHDDYGGLSIKRMNYYLEKAY